MSDHKFAAKLRHIFHRDSNTRSMQGRMRPVTCYDPMQQYHLFEHMLTNGSDLVLTTGCGLPRTLDELPVRFPSLIVPGLELMRSYHQAFGNDGKISYQVYQAGDFIQKINGIAPEKVQDSADFMQEYLQEFTQTYFGDIAHLVHFDFDKNVALDELSSIKDFLAETQDHKAQRHMTRIESYAKSDKDRGCAQNYAAANIYFNTMQDVSFDRPTTIMPIGGKKEEPFFYLTSAYASTHQKQVTVLPVTFNCQTRPPYYAVNAHDLTIGKLDNGTHDELVSAMENTSYLNLKDYQEMLLPLGITARDLVAMAQQVKQNNYALV